MSSTGLPGFSQAASTNGKLALEVLPAGIIVGVTLALLAIMFGLRVKHFLTWRGMWNPQELLPENAFHCAAFIFAVAQCVIYVAPRSGRVVRASQVLFMASLGASQMAQVLIYRRVFGWATKKLWKNFNTLGIITLILTIIPVAVAGVDTVQGAVGLILMSCSVLSECVVASIGPACFLVWMLDKPPPSFDDSINDPSSRHATIRVDLVRILAPIILCFWVIQFISNDGNPSVPTLVLQQVIIIISLASIPPFIPLMVKRSFKNRPKRNGSGMPMSIRRLRDLKNRRRSKVETKEDVKVPAVEKRSSSTDSRRDSHDDDEAQMSFEAFLASGPA